MWPAAMIHRFSDNNTQMCGEIEFRLLSVSENSPSKLKPRSTCRKRNSFIISSIVCRQKSLVFARTKSWHLQKKYVVLSFPFNHLSERWRCSMSLRRRHQNNNIIKCKRSDSICKIWSRTGVSTDFWPLTLVTLTATLANHGDDNYHNENHNNKTQKRMKIQ